MNEQFILDDINQKLDYNNAYLTRQENDNNNIITKLQNDYNEEIAKSEFDTTMQINKELGALDSTNSAERTRIETNNMLKLNELNKLYESKNSEYNNLSKLEKDIQNSYNEQTAILNNSITEFDTRSRKEIDDIRSKHSLTVVGYQSMIKNAELTAQRAQEARKAQEEARAQEAQRVQEEARKAQEEAIRTQEIQQSQKLQSQSSSNPIIQGPRPIAMPPIAEPIKLPTTQPSPQHKTTNVIETPLFNEKVDDKKTYYVYFGLILFVFVIIISLIIYKKHRGDPLKAELINQQNNNRIINILNGTEA